MAFIFGDGFDLYAATADTINGYWDSGTTTFFSLAAGRFTGSLALQQSSGGLSLVKSSSVTTDPIHHFVVSFKQTAAISGSTLGLYLQLVDGVTNQCCVVFRSDGTILLTSATPAGTILATYPNAFTLSNVWYAFEFEININKTTGSFSVRKNGNTNTDFTQTVTAWPGTNSYANKLQVGQNTGLNAQLFDDLLWRSDATSIAWMGDIRCYTRMPGSDVSTLFNRVVSIPPTTQTLVSPVGVANGFGANTAHYVQFTAPQSGLISGVTVNCNISGGGGTSHIKVALFSSAFGTIGTLMATSAEITNPGSALINFTFPTAGYVLRGQNYWIGINHDQTVTYNVANTGGTIVLSSPVYTSWPVSNPGGTTQGNNTPGLSVSYTPQYNADLVSEPQQDGTTSYVYSSNPTDADFYALSTFSATPVSVVMVTTRAYIQKSDAGSRSATVRLKSGATIAPAPTITLNSANFQWCWRTDATDPNTSFAWTPTAVTNLNIGPYVVS